MPKDIEDRAGVKSMLDASARQGILKPIRLVIVDRQPIVLQGLRSVLGAQQDFDVIAAASDGTSCLEAIRNLTPDVALIADTLPDLTAAEILTIAKAEELSTRLVFFIEHDAGPELTAAIAAGACSAISKYVAPANMLHALRLMTKSGLALERRDLAPADEADRRKIEQLLELLTDRERQIARLVSEGLSNKEIARKLNVSQGTVKVHLYNIFQKLEITNRTVLATIALLQRTSGFGTLALAFLAFAVADELKASEAKDMVPNADDACHAGEHPGYEVWKKAILQHLIVSGSHETPQFTERNFVAKASEVANPAAAIEALRAAEQFMAAKPWEDYAPAGSITPNLAALSPQRLSDTRIGSELSSEHQFPRLAANPTVQDGYATFAALAGALIYALSESDAAGKSLDPAHASIDSILASLGESATAKLATGAVVDVASAPSRLNLAAFGALTWLHLTAAAKSIPPHTLAWVYDAATNETIVYVNTTDRVLDVGDRALMEVHLQGIVSVAEQDVVQPEGSAVVATLEQLEQALASAIATDEAGPGTGSRHADEGARGSAGAWSALADDGVGFQFAPVRTGFETSANARAFTSEAPDTTGDSGGASHGSVHGSSTAPGQIAAVPVVEKLSANSEPMNAGNGAHSTQQNDWIPPGLAAADGTARGNSEHASEQASSEPAPSSTEPGNGAGKEAEHQAPPSKAAKGSAGEKSSETVEHGNSGPDQHSGSTNAPAATADSHAQHASEQVAAKGATDSSKPHDGAGHDEGHHSLASDDSRETKAAEKDGGEHGHAAQQGGGNAHQPVHPDATGSDAAKPAEVALASGAGHDAVFRFDGERGAFPLAAAIEPKELNEPHGPPGQNKDIQMIVETAGAAAEEHGAQHDNHGSHHAPASHDWLI